MAQKRFSAYFIVSVFATLLSLVACQPASHDSTKEAPGLELSQVIPFERSEEKPATHSNAEVIAILDKADHVSLPMKDQCAKQICGDPSLVFIPSDIAHGKTTETLEAKAFFETELRSRIEKAYDVEVGFERRTAKRIAEAIPQLRMQNLRLSKSYTSLLNALWFYRQIRSAARAVRSRKDGKFKLDAAVLKKMLPDLSAVDLETYKSLLSDYETSEEATIILNLSKFSLSDILKLQYPTVSLAQSEHEFGQRIHDRIHKLLITFPELNLGMPPSIEALANDKALSAEMSKNLPEDLMLSYFSRAVLEKTDLFSAREIPVSQMLTDFQQKDRLKKMILESTDAATIASQKEKLMAECRAASSRVVQSTVTPVEIENAQKLMLAIKDSMANVVLKELQVSDDMVPGIQQKIQGVKIQVPFRRDEVLAATIRALDGFAASEAQNAQSVSNYAIEAAFGAIDQYLDDGLDTTTKIKKLCNRFSPSGITDIALSKIDEINLSWQTVKFPAYGAGLMAHELGHVVSAELTRQTQMPFNSVKVCTSRRHETFEGKRGAFYAEEDFADLLGAHVMKDLRNKKYKIGNPACIILEKDESRWGTRRGLSFAWPEQITDDVHSTDFYRLIQFQLNSDQALPPSCQSVVDNFAASTKLQCVNQ